MSTTVRVNTYTNSVTYVTDKIIKSLKDVVRLSGLSPEKLVGQWSSIELAMSTWISSQHLKTVVLEIYDPTTNALITRWDIDIVYAWDGGDGGCWTDTAQLEYAIKKAGGCPATAKYDVLMSNKPNWPAVTGWHSTTFRSVEGFARQSLGTTVDNSGLGASSSYYRKVG